jgi:hypothetical protein
VHYCTSRNQVQFVEPRRAEGGRAGVRVVVLVHRILSGGQTGVDRAALDAAITHGRAYGGWCPAGGWAEDMVEPPGLLARYPALTESTGSDRSERTWLNVRDSHATLVVRGASVRSPGTDLTIEAAIRLGRPYAVTVDDAAAVLVWLATLGTDLTLNVAGPRASEDPGAYDAARELLADILAPDR